MEKYLKVSYVEANDIGPIYLEDIQQRSQLGAGLQKLIGQDIVINASDVIFLVNTGAVLMSTEKGIIGAFSTVNETTSVQSTNDGGALEYTVTVGGNTVFVDASGDLVDAAGDYIDEAGDDSGTAVAAVIGNLTATMEDVTGPADPTKPLIIEEVASIATGEIVRSGIPTGKADPTNSTGDF